MGTNMNASNMAQCVLTDGSATQTTILAFRVYYNGAAWVVSNTEGHSVQSGNISTNWNTNQLELDVTGIDRPFLVDPAMVATPKVGSIFRPTVTGDTATCIIQWLDKDDNIETTESTEMDCYVICVGLCAAYFAD